MTLWKSFFTHFKKLRSARVSVAEVLLRCAFFRMFGLQIFANGSISISGLRNIETLKPLLIGLNEVGFASPQDLTLINVRGKLNIRGKFHIGPGCRIDVGRDAVVDLNGGYITANTLLCIAHSLHIGSHCAISWGCQFVDDDHHHLDYEGKTQVHAGIHLGNNVWVGSNVSVLKGTRIADGCVIAAGSVVRGCFPEPCCLIGGNPAKVIRRNVKWEA